MSKLFKTLLSCTLILSLCVSAVCTSYTVVNASAAVFNDVNDESVFLKQETPVTCTLSSAVMILRRTAIAAGLPDWKNITETSTRSEGWVNGLGLLWNFTSHGMTVGHGYFSKGKTKSEMLSLLEKYPLGFVIYNGGNGGQSHAVLLTDYDKATDTFYAADPASTAPKGRIKLTETTILGKTQQEQIDNLTSYWYVSSPNVVYENGEYSVNGFNGDYDPKPDLNAFSASSSAVNKYFVVTSESSDGCAFRYQPSGNGVIAEKIENQTIVYITEVGKNDFGATWYKSADGHYVFSSNVTEFSEYSEDTKKFESTAVKENSTYTVNAVCGKKTAVRLVPTEGNNIIGYANNGAYIYAAASGVNTAESKWLKTSNGYYIKKSDMKFASDGKLENSDYSGKILTLSGKYSASPIQDSSEETLTSAEYIITASFLNMRESPVDGDVIVSIPKNTVVKVTEILSGWARVDYNGAKGWISLEYAEKTENNNPLPLTIKTVTTDKNKVHCGEKIVCTATVENGKNCVYRFSVCDSAGKVVYKSEKYINSSKIEYIVQKAGTYYLLVDVKDSDGRTASEVGSKFTVLNKLIIASVGSNTDGFSEIGQAVVWTADTVSASDSAEYNYALLLDGKVIDVKTSKSNKYSFTPTKNGNYVLQTFLFDELSESDVVLSDTVTVYEPLAVMGITVNDDTVVTGESLDCTVDAVGGLGNYRYKFSLMKDGNIIRTGGFGEENTKSFRVYEAGTYSVLCVIQDERGAVAEKISNPINVIDYIIGDMTGDGKVTAADARIALRLSAKLENMTELLLVCGDVNKDGKVNASDARIILRCAANLDSIIFS